MVKYDYQSGRGGAGGFWGAMMSDISNPNAIASAFLRNKLGNTTQSVRIISCKNGYPSDDVLTSQWANRGIRPAIHIALSAISPSNIIAGFSPNAVTGAGAGVTVN